LCIHLQQLQILEKALRGGWRVSSKA
jgi:hypothetical protein